MNQGAKQKEIVEFTIALVNESHQSGGKSLHLALNSWEVLGSAHAPEPQREHHPLSSVQFSSTAAHQASLSITNSQSLLRRMSIVLVMPSSHLILCCPLLLLPSIFPSIRVFSNELVLHMRWPKYWSFSFSIRPSNEHPGLISFRMDWLDFLAVQEALKSLLQHHTSKASTLYQHHPLHARIRRRNLALSVDDCYFTPYRALCSQRSSKCLQC